MGCERQPVGQEQAISTVTDGEVRFRAVAVGWGGGRVASTGRLTGLGRGGPSEAEGSGLSREMGCCPSL